MKYGYATVAAAIPSVKVADTDYNVAQITSMISEAEERGVEIIVFPNSPSPAIHARISSVPTSCSDEPRSRSSHFSTTPARWTSSPSSECQWQWMDCFSTVP